MRQGLPYKPFIPPPFSLAATQKIKGRGQGCRGRAQVGQGLQQTRSGLHRVSALAPVDAGPAPASGCWFKPDISAHPVSPNDSRQSLALMATSQAAAAGRCRGGLPGWIGPLAPRVAPFRGGRHEGRPRPGLASIPLISPFSLSSFFLLCRFRFRFSIRPFLPPPNTLALPDDSSGVCAYLLRLRRISRPLRTSTLDGTATGATPLPQTDPQIRIPANPPVRGTGGRVPRGKRRGRRGSSAGRATTGQGTGPRRPAAGKRAAGPASRSS